MSENLIKCKRIFEPDREGEATHHSFQLAEGDGGTVEEIGRQPALVLITVANRSACGGGELSRGEKQLKATVIYCHYHKVI